MPASSEDEYDSDSASEFEASETQLGLADGYLEVEDEANPLVSRIGGRAAWLPMRATPPHETALCKTCGQEMQLLVQIFAPLEGSAYDRCLLVWGCARSKCQRTDASSLRVIRTLKYNSRWAAKLAKQKARQEARQEAHRARQAAQDKARKEQEELSKVNPFSVSAAGGPNSGLGNMLFGSATNPFATEAPTKVKPQASTPLDLEAAQSDSEDEEEQSETERLAEELAIKTDLESVSASTSWATLSTRYPSLYLNTIPEPSSSSLSKKLTAQEADLLKKASQAAPGEAGNFDENELKGFAKEGYEKMTLDGVDDTFERFVKRVSVEGRQVVRYEFGGEPIAFHARGAVYNMLWPRAAASRGMPGDQTSVTRSQIKANTLPDDRAYTASHIPPCPACGAPRVFEAQLMPNLINTLRAETIQDANGTLLSETADKDMSEEDRRKRDIERALGRSLPTAANAEGEAIRHTGAFLDSVTGLVWSTAFVFVCSKDCCIPAGPESQPDECWREEFIAAQFEDE